MIKDGPSTLTLTAATNSLSGTTLVDDGTLVGTAANLGPVSVASGANVTIYQTASGTLNKVVSGAGSLTSAGPATLTIGVPQQYTGTTIVNAGTLKLGAPVLVQTQSQYASLYLNMDGPLGAIASGTTIPDSSGNGKNAIMAGNGASYVAGQFNQGINLTSGQYLTAPPVNNGVIGTYTVSFWMDNANTTQSYYSICTTRSGASAWVGAMQIAYAYSEQGNTGPGIYIENWTNQGWGYYGVLPTPTLTPGVWNMVTATFQTGSLTLYVNGQPVVNQPWTKGANEVRSSGDDPRERAFRDRLQRTWWS